MGLFANNKRTVVVSLDAILNSKGIRGRALPRQQLQALRSLSRMVQRENMNVTTVIVGEALNKAPDNKVFDGVRVRYVKQIDQTNSMLIKSLKQAGGAGVLVTEDTALEEQVLKMGKDTLRLSTFRKLIDDGVDGGQDNNNNNGGNRKNRRDRSDRKKQRRPKGDQQPKKQKEPKKTSEQDEISQMIDLVD